MANKRPPGQRPGRAKGTVNKKTAQYLEAAAAILQRLKCDPIEGLARMAIGDVVAMGYMTDKELREPPQFDSRGRVIRTSGMERALSYLPPSLRYQSFRELANYVYPKRMSVAHTDPDGKPLQASVIVALPPNGR